MFLKLVSTRASDLTQIHTQPEIFICLRLGLHQVVRPNEHKKFMKVN